MGKKLKDRDGDEDAEDVTSGLHLARVEDVEEEIARSLRLIVVHFVIVKGRFRRRRLHGRFVFDMNWHPGRNSTTGDDLGGFLRHLNERLDWDAKGPPQTVAASDLVGAVGLIGVGARPGHHEPDFRDFYQVRLAPGVFLRQWRIEHGVTVDDALIKTRKPSVSVCPGCLRDVNPEIADCPNCKLDQREFWAEHCGRCLFEADDAELHCSLCGAALAGTEDAEAENRSGPKTSSVDRCCRQCGDSIGDVPAEFCADCETAIVGEQDK